ncbi:hypothetical protein [Halochromatium glycolicum]|uniref:hypothetical protein n=1 Tax=Halochromatium glycolicum TaxID=85075 RepID=UPI00190C7A47
MREQLDQHPGPASAEQIARLFKRAPTKKVAELLQTLATLGQVRQDDRDRFSNAS